MLAPAKQMPAGKTEIDKASRPATEGNGASGKKRKKKRDKGSEIAAARGAKFATKGVEKKDEQVLKRTNPGKDHFPGRFCAFAWYNLRCVYAQ